jgi:hypothetical protein
LEEVIKGLVLGKDMCDDQEHNSVIRYRRHKDNRKELERNKKEGLGEKRRNWRLAYLPFCAKCKEYSVMWKG